MAGDPAPSRGIARGLLVGLLGGLLGGPVGAAAPAQPGLPAVRETAGPAEATAILEAPRRGRFAGTWAGVVTQSGTVDPGEFGSVYGFRVTIKRVGRRYRANVEYPELLCGGIWKLEERRGRTLVFTERIKYNGVCSDGVVVSVKTRADGGLDYRFDHQQLTGTSTGTAVLQRARGKVGPGNKEPGHGVSQYPTSQQEAGSALMIWFGAAWRAGEWNIGFPTWQSCIAQDLCLAGAGDEVGLVARGQFGFYTVDEWSVDLPARMVLAELGYDEPTAAALLS